MPLNYAMHTIFLPMVWEDPVDGYEAILEPVRGDYELLYARGWCCIISRRPSAVSSICSTAFARCPSWFSETDRATKFFEMALLIGT